MKNTFFKLLICAAICSAAAFGGCSADGTSGTDGNGQEQNTVTRSLTDDATDGSDENDKAPDGGDETAPNETPDERPNDIPPDFPPPPRPRRELPHGGGRHVPLPHHGHEDRPAPPNREETPTDENSVLY